MQHTADVLLTLQIEGMPMWNSIVWYASVSDHDGVHASWWEDQEIRVLCVKSQVTLSSVMSVDGILYPLWITVLYS
jgi:predicted transporter